VLQDRRKSSRIAISGRAKIQAHAGALPRDCSISDISDGGVRLHAEYLEVPEQFILVLADNATRPRECRVIWRLGCEIGAEFIDRSEKGFARQLAGSAPR
jgi:hypothetical protein